MPERLTWNEHRTSVIRMIFLIIWLALILAFLVVGYEMSMDR